MSTQPSLEQIKSKVAATRKRNPAYGEVVAWLGELLALTLEAAPPRLPQDLDLAARRAGERLTAGRPMFEPGDLPLDLDLARDLLSKLMQNAAQRPQGREQAAGLGCLLAAPPARFQEVVTAFLAGDQAAQAQAAEELGLAPPVQNLFLRLALRPSLLAVAQMALEGLDLAPWTAGHCPVCGTSPRLASLAGEGGRRSLHCPTCETLWPHRRLCCPFCDNQEPEDLVVLTAEGQEGYRLDICRRCGQYLKTLDLRSLAGPVIPVLDDLVTWHMDLVAENYLEENPVASLAS